MDKTESFIDPGFFFFFKWQASLPLVEAQFFFPHAERSGLVR